MLEEREGQGRRATAVRPPSTRTAGPWVRVRRARSPAELADFRAGYWSVSGYPVDQDYLQRAAVFVVVQDGLVVGGFVLNTEPPLRTIARLPDLEQDRVAAAFPADDTVEVACVWLLPHARGPIASATLWSQLMWRVGRTDGSHVVFGTEVDGLRQLYERMRPQVLYSGRVRVDGVERHGWVYAMSTGGWPAALLRLLVARWGR
jgi:hypothetical protein